MGSFVFLRFRLIDALEMSRAWAYTVSFDRIKISFLNVEFYIVNFAVQSVAIIQSSSTRNFLPNSLPFYLQRSYLIRPCCIREWTLQNFALYLAHGICAVFISKKLYNNLYFATLHERSYFLKVQKLCISTRWVISDRPFIISYEFGRYI